MKNLSYFSLEVLFFLSLPPPFLSLVCIISFALLSCKKERIAVNSSAFFKRYTLQFILFNYFFKKFRVKGCLSHTKANVAFPRNEFNINLQKICFYIVNNLISLQIFQELDLLRYMKTILSKQKHTAIKEVLYHCLQLSNIYYWERSRICIPYIYTQCKQNINNHINTPHGLHSSSRPRACMRMIGFYPTTL